MQWTTPKLQNRLPISLSTRRVYCLAGVFKITLRRTVLQPLHAPIERHRSASLPRIGGLPGPFPADVVKSRVDPAGLPDRRACARAVAPGSPRVRYWWEKVPSGWRGHLPRYRAVRKAARDRKRVPCRLRPNRPCASAGEKPSREFGRGPRHEQRLQARWPPRGAPSQGTGVQPFRLHSCLSPHST
jgi:hypothetical protein